ncbi:Arylacetamide deacetylase-like protein [Zalerion maritima]|uniref:Arylacetamide deacetylase-like protein n=1 Tax=Zalerion maritima TaxID=339359 RepID=A0AAD5RZ23_9PEZI|nr:Arylacetamide deacetylase-like protein [Zalerion maritima]
MLYLGPVSLVDCVAFCFFLALELVRQVGFFPTAWVVLQALPFLCLKVPLGLLYCRLPLERLASRIPFHKRSPFVRKSSLFEDLVIRCVRYAFANVPPKIGRVFMCREVVTPFLTFRLIRHGRWWRTPHCHEHVEVNWTANPPSPLPPTRNQIQNGTDARQPKSIFDSTLGGGFSMGSSFFYLEFLMTWVKMLEEAGYQSPAIFALEYTLVPDATFPTQLNEAFAGYEYVTSVVNDPQILCVSGDSAGGALALSLLLFLSRMADLAKQKDRQDRLGGYTAPGGPKMAILLSPWTTMISDKHQNTSSDFLNATTLHEYARRYAGAKPVQDHLISPGHCRNRSAWAGAGVGKFCFIYGSEEVLATDIADFADYLARCDIEVETHVLPDAIHVWPVISLFLSSREERRLEGLRAVVQSIRGTMK